MATADGDLALLRSRAERHLARLALGRSDFAPLRERRLAYLEAALGAYAALGLVDDAESWRDRAQEPTAATSPPAASSSAALRLVEDRFRAYEGSRDRHAHARLVAALQAATLGGDLSAADAGAMHERLQDGRLEPGSHAHRLVHALRAATFTDLRAVVPGPVLLPSGTCVVSLELYDGGAILHWQLEEPVTAPAPSAPDLAIEAEDDVGTEYLAHGGGAGGGSGVWRGHSLILPAPPPDASELRVRLAGELVRATLPREGRVGALR
jgi:hypothetical protein